MEKLDSWILLHLYNAVNSSVKEEMTFRSQEICLSDRTGFAVLYQVQLREDIPLLILETVTYMGSFWRRILHSLQVTVSLGSGNVLFRCSGNPSAKCTGFLWVFPYYPHRWCSFVVLIYSSCLNFHQRHGLLSSHLALFMNSFQLVLSIWIVTPEPNTNFGEGGAVLGAVQWRRDHYSCAL